VIVAMIERGVLATIAGPDVVRMSPPLVASDEDVAAVWKRFGL